MQSAIPDNPADLVVLIDHKPLRREAYTALLTPWAGESKLRLLGLGPSDYEPSTAAALVIFSNGSASITDLRLQEERIDIDEIRAPVVIVSDRDDPSEVIAAMALGVKGYLPTRLPAELALKTLTFILSGGDFFPPSALRSTAIGGLPASKRKGWKGPRQPQSNGN